jgi:hypothetical protein
MKTKSMIQNHGFALKKPSIEYLPISFQMLTGITSRDFGHPYEEMQDMICGNLYLWLQQTYDVLWRIDEETGKVIIYQNTTDKLGERFATLLRISKEDGKTAIHEMVKSLAWSNYIIEQVVFKIEGNWLLKNRNPQLKGLLKHFMFWLATFELNENENALNGLAIFMKKFAKDVDLEVLKSYSTDEIFQAFIKCFFHCNNDVNLLVAFLENSNVSLSEIFS